MPPLDVEFNLQRFLEGQHKEVMDRFDRHASEVREQFKSMETTLHDHEHRIAATERIAKNVRKAVWGAVSSALALAGMLIKDLIYRFIGLPPSN